jgi:DICT domain-containing protein
VTHLAIKDVAERTGIAAGTIRMWEQRYGFPVPERTASGYRRYTAQDVDVLQRVAAFRESGLSVPAAIERARVSAEPAEQPSIYGAILSSGAPVQSQQLRKRTLISISRAIEDEMLARGTSPVVVGAFQQERNYRVVQHRYRRLAQVADVAIVFADFPELRVAPDEPTEIPVSPDESIGNEWAVVVDAPGFAACLLAWEHPRSRAEEAGTADGERRFESLWTMDPEVVRRASLASAALASKVSAEIGEGMELALRDRPLAMDSPAPALTALCNRMIAYLEG